MAGELTECKTCKKEVSKSAKVCPHCGQNAPGVNGKKMAIGCLFFIILVVIMAAMAECGKNQSSTAVSKEPFEYKLATLNANGYVDKNDVTVVRFRYLLNNISQRTGYPAEKIGDMTVFTQNQLRDKYGKEIGLLDLMEGANKALSGHDMQIKYEEIMAMMLVMLSQ